MKNVLRAPFRALLRKGWPRTHGRIAGLPLGDDVEVARDRWGIAHITAKSPHDLLFAQGYVHAQDRLWQMETMRRLSEGRLSEIAGEQTVGVDWLCRTVGMADMKSRAHALFSDEERSLCQAYADGVNACVQGMGRRLPIEFSALKFSPAPWSPADCVSVLPYLAFTQLFGHWAQKLLAVACAGKVSEEEWNDMFPGYPGAALQHDGWFEEAGSLKLGPLLPGALVFHAGLTGQRAASELSRAVLSAAGPGGGSNNWVVARGPDGRPILESDPHLGASLPAVWYFCHLRVPGVLNVAGATLAGSPGVIIGRNDRVAWGLTNFMLDALDILTYRVDPHDPLRYFHGTGEGRMRQEQIVVGLPKGRSVKLPVFFTEQGPALTALDKGVNAVAVLKWYGTIAERELQDRSLRGVLGFMKARSAAELLEAASNWKYVSMNFVAGDIDGHIGWQVTGAAPVRTGYSGRLPGDASAGAGWSGFRPFEAMPHVLDPEEGYLASANNRPERCSEGPELSYLWCAPHRYRRIASMIRGMHGPGVADFQALQMDIHSGEAERILPRLSALVFQNPRAKEAVALLAGWDKELTAESTAAALFEVFLTELMRCLLGEKLGDDLGLYFNALAYGLDHEILERPKSPLWKGEMQRHVETALVKAVDVCERRMGKDRRTWRWGRLHRHVFRHPLASRGPAAWFNPPPTPANGDSNTINVSWPVLGDGSYDVTTVPSMRLIAPLGDPDGLHVVGPLGQSGQPGHRHYDDLNSMWLKGDLVRVPMTEEGVRRVTVETLILERA